MFKCVFRVEQICIVRATMQIRAGHFWKASRMFPVSQPDEKAPSEAGVGDSISNSLKLMAINHMLHGQSAGTMLMLPITTRVLEKLYRLIDREMQSIGAQKITMPCLSPASLWKMTGRWNDMGSELFQLKDRHDSQHCLAPTHEEAVTELVASEGPISHKRLPIKLYQIGRKFRDEMKPKNGLLRCREFEMKDLYTFDSDEALARKTYNEVCDAYERLFNKLGLTFVKAEASTGAMGGVRSHEFVILSPAGEDVIFRCSSCKTAWNEEIFGKVDAKGKHQCKTDGCHGQLEARSGIELAHAFLLGTRYSEVFEANVVDEQQKRRPMYMGCFGIGVTRLIAASIEALSDPRHIQWPRLIAPYQICVIPQKEGFKADVTTALAEELCHQLSDIPNLAGEVVLDDRLKLSIGKRMIQAQQQGYPYAVILGKKALDDSPQFEFVDVYSKQTTFLTRDEIVTKLSALSTVVI